MRFTFVILIASICLGNASPVRAADTLTGEMAGRNFLLGGSWSCTSAVPSIIGMPARTDTMTLTFDVAPHNVLHVALGDADYRGDEYVGYSARFKNYWSTTASSHAIHSFATSTDGTTFTGTSYLRTASMDDTTTYTKIGPTKTAVHEVLSGNGTFTIETTCSR
jgi:hypothetical protein